MNVQLTASGLVAAAVLAAGVVFLVKVRKPGAGLFDAVNPASPDNVVYSGISSIGASISGDKDWSVGNWLSDLFPSSAERQVNAIYGTPPYLPAPYVDQNGAIVGLPL